jgi:hypothetical protein
MELLVYVLSGVVVIYTFILFYNIYRTIRHNEELKQLNILIKQLSIQHEIDIKTMVDSLKKTKTEKPDKQLLKG